MLSVVNRVCARPHRPRDGRVREICSWAGVTWPEPERHVGGEEEESEDEEPQEEEEEEEEFTDDEETLPLPGACI